MSEPRQTIAEALAAAEQASRPTIAQAIAACERGTHADAIRAKATELRRLADAMDELAEGRAHD